MSEIKILTVYHKPAPLLHNDCVVPIQAGRAVMRARSKDGMISDADAQWMTGNLIGDDTGDNISDLNRSVNEATVMYWAWKNRDRLGNPKWIGLMHYRRHFVFRFERCARDYEHAIGIDAATIEEIVGEGRYGSFVRENVRNDRESAALTHAQRRPRDRFQQLYENCRDFAIRELRAANPVFGAHLKTDLDEVGMSNMFVMRWDDFEEYASLLFPVVLKICDQFGEESADIVEKRIPGFVIEWLTSRYAAMLRTRHEQRWLSVVDPTARVSPATRLRYALKAFFGCATQRNLDYLRDYRVYAHLQKLGGLRATSGEVSAPTDFAG